MDSPVALDDVSEVADGVPRGLSEGGGIDQNTAGIGGADHDRLVPLRREAYAALGEPLGRPQNNEPQEEGAIAKKTLGREVPVPVHPDVAEDGVAEFGGDLLGRAGFDGQLGGFLGHFQNG